MQILAAISIFQLSLFFQTHQCVAGLGSGLYLCPASWGKRAGTSPGTIQTQSCSGMI